MAAAAAVVCTGYSRGYLGGVACFTCMPQTSPPVLLRGAQPHGTILDRWVCFVIGSPRNAARRPRPAEHPVRRPWPLGLPSYGSARSKSQAIGMSSLHRRHCTSAGIACCAAPAFTFCLCRAPLCYPCLLSAVQDDPLMPDNLHSCYFLQCMHGKPRVVC